MSIETIPEIEHGLEVTEDNFAYEDKLTLTEQIEQVEVERGRFMSYVSKLAGRAALVGALAAGVFVGSGEVAEAAPAPTAPVACTKNGVQGMKLGQLCVTKQEVRQSGACSKTDKFIAAAAMDGVFFGLPVSAVTSLFISLGYDATTAYVGDFCD